MKNIKNNNNNYNYVMKSFKIINQKNNNMIEAKKTKAKRVFEI